MVLKVPTVKTEAGEVTPLELTVILLDPAAMAEARPLLSMVVTSGLLDAHVNVPKAATVPSDNNPDAVNCFVPPVFKALEDGVMVRDDNAGAVTVKVALLEVTPLADAVIVLLPAVREDATPLLFTVATVVLLDAQVAEPEILPVLPSE